jgi:hypothetical protein
LPPSPSPSPARPRARGRGPGAGPSWYGFAGPVRGTISPIYGA